MIHFSTLSAARTLNSFAGRNLRNDAKRVIWRIQRHLHQLQLVLLHFGWVAPLSPHSVKLSQLGRADQWQIKILLPHYLITQLKSFRNIFSNYVKLQKRNIVKQEQLLYSFCIVENGGWSNCNCLEIFRVYYLDVSCFTVSCFKTDDEHNEAPPNSQHLIH